MSEVNPNLPVAPPLAVSPGEAARLVRGLTAHAHAADPAG